VTQLLSAARVAFRDEKLLPRPDGELHGDSALELYVQVLAQDATNDEATDGVSRLLNLARPRIQSDLSTGKFDDASRLVGLFKSTGVGADSVRDLESSLGVARPKWLTTHVQESIAAGDLSGAEQGIAQLSSMGVDRNTLAELHRAMDNKRQEQQVQASATEVRAAISAGNLLEPANDSARTRLQALRGLSRNGATTVAVQRELQAALLERSQDASRKGQFDVAKRYLAAAAEIGSNSEVNDVSRQLQTDMDQAAAQRAAAAEAETKAKEAAAANTAAAAAANSQAANAVQYISPRPLQQLTVEYPRDASDERRQGYVVVEFTLQSDGSATGATVVDAHPAHVFNRAAVKAVQGARYDTAPLAGRASAKARLKISFKPD
jgi:TonB family protein